MTHPKIRSSRPSREFLSTSLPPLPSVIRYFDDFLDEPCSIRRPADTDRWEVSVRGTVFHLDFTAFEVDVRSLLKGWCSFQLQNFAGGTAAVRFSHLRLVSPSDLVEIISSVPVSVRETWQVLRAKKYNLKDMDSLKSILYYFCRHSLFGWSSDYLAFLSTLPMPGQDKFAGVRSGDVFLSVDEEAVLVAYFDDLSHALSRHADIADITLRNAAILICSFQFGLRPMQIGMLQMRDVRIWRDTDDARPSVHLTFKMIKQRSRSKAMPLVRKVKREWAPLFVELYDRAKRRGIAGTERFFGLSSAQATAQVISAETARLLPEGRCATELRHTAAQRLVDAGASQEELAEFMGHSDIDTGLVYFQTSPTQAERVNRAMGISSVYCQVARIAHERFISAEELATLKEDQQIGAVPHGIPIAGIGACSIGQPSCPSNPATACYGCFKFMPINDPEIHRHVLADFRSVVALFSEASKNDEKSPAYVQLKRTISNVLSIISELEGSEHE